MRLAIAVLIELMYVLVRFQLGRTFVDPIKEELALTSVRAIVALAYWVLFRDLVGALHPKTKVLWKGLFFCGMGLLVAEAVLKTQDALAPSLSGRLVFASTSLVVGWREEYFYRGVLQNLLHSKVGPAMGLLVANAFFVLYHIGTAPFVLASISQWFLLGLAFSFIYLATRSVLATALAHAAYDAVFALGPYHVAPPVGIPSILLIDFIAVGVLIYWARQNTDFEW
jgi:membrane protease YdiL (CAAX protease family)